jgi:hypothetical protein
VFNNQTLPQIAHTSLGRTEVRMRVSNAFGTDSLVIGAARIGLRATEPQVVPGTNKVLTFSGCTSITIPPGDLAVSDRVNLEVPPLGDLSISLYLPDSTLGSTQYTNGWQTNYLLADDQTASVNPAVVTSPPANYNCMSYYFLTDVEVYAREASVIVCLGDSVTDGDILRRTRTIAGPIFSPSGFSPSANNAATSVCSMRHQRQPALAQSCRTKRARAPRRD